MGVGGRGRGRRGRRLRLGNRGDWGCIALAFRAGGWKRDGLDGCILHILSRWLKACQGIQTQIEKTIDGWLFCLLLIKKT